MPVLQILGKIKFRKIFLKKSKFYVFIQFFVCFVVERGVFCVCLGIFNGKRSKT